MAWNISKAKRQALVKLQLRDKEGKFIEMGGGVKWYSSRLKKVVAGTVVGTKGENALVRLNKENPTHEPALVTVPAASIIAIEGKASLSPKGEGAPSADQTPEFEKPDAVADVEADPNAEADSDHMSQLKGPQHLAANYGITETPDGNTYITRNDGESIYSPARALKVGDELISPAGADPTKPFSIGRGWATKGTERLNKEGEGPVIGKVIAISENRYAVVQMAGGHTIPDRRNPEEQTDTVTVGLSNQVILATMGLKDALGDRVSSQTYAERPSDEEKEIAPDAPEAQSDHEGREVPEDQLEAEGEAAPVDRAQVLKDMPVGGRIQTEDESQVFEKRASNQWAFVSGNGDLIKDSDVLGMVGRGEADGQKYQAYVPEDGENAPESAPEGAEAPQTQPAPESPAEEAPEAVEAPSNDIEESDNESTPVEDVPDESAGAKATPVNNIVEGLAELEQAVEDVDGSGLEDEESEEVLNGASFDVTTADGSRQTVSAEKDENGDWNFVVADENGAEVASHVIGSDENRVLAERIANPSASKKAEAAPEATPEATPEAESYNENGLTEEEQRELTSYTRLAARSYDQFKDAEGDRYKALADELLAKGEERKVSAPAQREETAPESAPEPEAAPESAPEETKPVEDAPAPSLVEPDAAPEEADAPQEDTLPGLSDGVQDEIKIPGVRKQPKKDNAKKHLKTLNELEEGDRVSYTNAHDETSTYQKHADGTWDLLDPEDEWEDESPLEEALTADQVAQRHKRGELDVQTVADREQAERDARPARGESYMDRNPDPVRRQNNGNEGQSQTQQAEQDANAADQPWSVAEIQGNMSGWFDFAQAVKNGDSRAIETMSRRKREGDEESFIVTNDKGQPVDVTMTYNEDGDPVVRLSNFDDSSDVYGDFEIDTSVMPRHLSTLIHESINSDDISAAVTERNGSADRELDAREAADAEAVSTGDTPSLPLDTPMYIGRMPQLSQDRLANAVAESSDSGIEMNGDDDGYNVTDADKAEATLRPVLEALEKELADYQREPNQSSATLARLRNSIGDFNDILTDINEARQTQLFRNEHATDTEEDVRLTERDAEEHRLAREEAAPVNGEEGFVPIDGRGLKGKNGQKESSETPTEEAPASSGPFDISLVQQPDGLDHAVATSPEAMTPEELEEFEKLDIELMWAQHNNRAGREATVRGKFNALNRRIQSRLDQEAMARHKNDGPPNDSVEDEAPLDFGDDPYDFGGGVEESDDSSAETEAPETAPVVNPEANEDGLLPDEAARLTDLENRLGAAFRGESNEDTAQLDQEISELIRHGRLRGRGREVGPFRASNPVPDQTSEQDSSEVPETAPDVAPESVPEAPEAPAARRTRNSEPIPVADADGNMITRGDKVGHPTLGPVEITNTIPGTGRVEFIDPTTGRKKSVKAARVRKIDPNAAEAAPEEQPTTAAPGSQFIDAATGKQGFGDKNGNRVLVGDRVRHTNGNTGTVKAVYTAGSGGAWPAVQWDNDGKVRRAMGNVLEADNSSAPEATPEVAPEPMEVVRPSATRAPAPERVEPAEEPFEPARPSATPAPALTPEPEAATDADFAGSAKDLPIGSKVYSTDGQMQMTKHGDNQWTIDSRQGELIDNATVDGQVRHSQTQWGMTFKQSVPGGSAQEETFEAATERRMALVAATPVGKKIASSDGSQNFYRLRENQWQFNEGSLINDTGVVNFIALGEGRGMSFEIADGRPAEVNDTPVVDVPSAAPKESAPEVRPATDASLPDVYSPENKERNTSRLRELPTGTKISVQGGGYTLTKTGSDSWSSTVDGGVYDTDDIYNIIRGGREGGLVYRVDRPASAQPTVLPTVTLDPIPLDADSLVPPTVASRLEAFRRAPIGTTVTSPGGTTTYTKQGTDQWSNPDIVGALVKNSTLAIATDSDNGHWIFNKTGPAEPEGVNITAMRMSERLRALRQAPVGTKLTSTGGKVITKTSANRWTTDAGTEYSPGMLAVVVGDPTVSGPFGLTLPETGNASENESDNTLPTNRSERRAAIAGLPLGSKISVRGYSFKKVGVNAWDMEGEDEPHTDLDVAHAGSESEPGEVTLPTPIPVPQDLASRISVSEESPIGTIVTNTTGDSYTKISEELWADTATRSFKYALGEFASKLQNNMYTGDYFVQGFEPAGGEFTGGPLSSDSDERERQIAQVPEGGTVTGGRNNTTFVRRGPDLWSPDSNPEEYYSDADLSFIALAGDNPAVAAPPADTASNAPAAPAIHNQLPKGSFVPSAAGSKSGVKKVGDDKWEMIKDGQPTGRFVNDEAVSVIQELVGSEVYNPRVGNNVGMYAEDLKLPGGKSLGQYLESGGSYGALTNTQKKAIRDGYTKFIDNLNTLLPEGFRAELEGDVHFDATSMSTYVQFYQGNRRLGTTAERRFSSTTDERTGKRVSSVDHAYWHLADDAQGAGISAAFLQASKQMYRQMGLDRITVHADISIGSYAWARGGFDFSTPDKIVSAMQAWDGAWGRAPRGREEEWKEGERQFRELKAKATRENWMAGTHPPAVAFANIGRPTDPSKTGPEDKWFGKEMLKHTHWWGYFPLNSDPASGTVAAS